MKKAFAIALSLVLAIGVYFSLDSGKPQVTPASAAKTYTGTVYVAGMGGHFAAAKVTIDPSNAENPIKIDNLDRVETGGNKDTHPTHDPRVDVNDKNNLLWSTYKADKKIEGGKSMHIGSTNLKDGKIVDKVVTIDEKGMKFTGALYCASGQTKDSYMPVTMTDLPYIDVFSKKDFSLKSRIFMPEYKEGDTFFFHGTNNDQLDKFALAVNLKTEGKPNGKFDFYTLDLKALEAGKVSVIKKTQISGEPGKTLTFRQDFTPDGKLILQSGADRMFLLDAATLETKDVEMMNGIGENHDVVSTADGKFGVLTLRVSVGEEKDGMLQLYDVEKKALVGKPVSVCFGCHTAAGVHGSATLCGADVNWN